MKPPVAKLKPELERQTRKATEDFAAVELKPDVVRMRIYEAATKGLTALRLRLPEGIAIDMRGTTAAVKLQAWCDQNGLTLSWESRVAELADGRRITIHEPEIVWSAGL